MVRFKIKMLREQRGISQAELAAKSGVSRTIVSALETGSAKDTTVSTLKKISTTLGVKIEDIFFEEKV